MKLLLTILLTCVCVRAQSISPYNVEVMPGAQVTGVSFGYRPHLLVVWDPRTTSTPIRLNNVGLRVSLTVRQVVVFHPVGWTGEWNGFQLGTRLIASNFHAIYAVWPFSGPFEYLTGLSITLNVPGEIGVDYGTWAGACCYGYSPKPILAAMLLEVSL